MLLRALLVLLALLHGSCQGQRNIWVSKTCARCCGTTKDGVVIQCGASVPGGVVTPGIAVTTIIPALGLVMCLYMLGRRWVRTTSSLAKRVSHLLLLRIRVAYSIAVVLMQKVMQRQGVCGAFSVAACNLENDDPRCWRCSGMVLEFFCTRCDEPDIGPVLEESLCMHCGFLQSPAAPLAHIHLIQHEPGAGYAFGSVPLAHWAAPVAVGRRDGAARGWRASNFGPRRAARSAT